MRVLVALLWSSLVILPVRIEGQIPARSPELARRADSLAGLDPGTEVRKAIARRDHRLIAVCGYACVPPGVDLRDTLVQRALERLRPIVGTSDAILNADVARLNKVSSEYATRYNRLLLAALRRRASSRPAS